MTELGLAEALRKLKDHSAGHSPLSAAEAVRCAYVIEEHRRWNNKQIQRIADAIGMPHNHSEVVVNAALELLGTLKMLGTAMIPPAGPLK